VAARTDGRFPDDTPAARLTHDEASSRDTALNYWLPLFRRLWPDDARAPRILSVGCGIGVDVEVLREHGFDIIGIDPGSRSRAWTQRRHRDRFLLANGLRLPFRDDAFDAVFCGCVYPHVGVVGDTARPAATCREDRLALAKEMVRVVKPGGRLFVSGANRRCPIDLFHDRDPGRYVPRVNAPWSRFLLDVGDYTALFAAAGAVGASALPVAGYWGFVTSRRTRKGRLLALPVRLLFQLTSQRRLAFLRGSLVDPWIVVAARKPATAD
jgi:SAM-dependent methyltransferase